MRVVLLAGIATDEKKPQLGRAETQRRWRERNKEKVRATQKRWLEKNPTYMHDYNKAHKR